MVKLCIRGFTLSALLLWSCVVSVMPAYNYHTKISPFSIKINGTNYYGNRDGFAITVYIADDADDEEAQLDEVEIIYRDEVRYTLDFSDGAPQSVSILEDGRQREYIIEIIPSPPMTDGSLFPADGFRLIFHEGQLTDTTNVHEIRQRLNGKYRLMNPIMLTAAFDPIGGGNDPFTGIFDGNDKSISHLKIVDNQGTPQDYVGFFGAIGGNGEVRNLTLVLAEGDAGTPSIEGGNYVGALAGESLGNTHIEGVKVLGGFIKGKNNVGGLMGYSASTITHSHATGDVTSESTTSGNNEGVGGLVGRNTGDIENSSATGEVRDIGTATDPATGNNVGGLVGFSSGSTITNSHATGNVTGKGDRVGGLVGHASTSSTIENSHATGDVTGEGDNVGGLVGKTANQSEIIKSYATGSVEGEDNVGGLVGHSLSSIQYPNQSFKGITDSYATGNVTGKGASSTAGDEGGVGGLVGWNAGAIENSHATGEVVGNGDNVGGLVGLLSEVGVLLNGSTITNSHATGDVTGKGDRVGGLVGDISPNSSITGSYATGNVTGEGASSTAGGVGGLVGHVRSSTISNKINGSYATGNVTGKRDVGGLVGINKGSITNSHAEGASHAEGILEISTTDGSQSLVSNVGGLVGYNTGTVTGSHAEGAVRGIGIVTDPDPDIDTVIGGSDNVGGLVGLNIGELTETYATGNVTSEGDSVGGLVGVTGTGSTITKSYATGSVKGKDKVGGLVGHDNSGVTLNIPSIANSYATGSVEGRQNVGGLVGHAQSTISKTYAVGAVSGDLGLGGVDVVGGLVGFLDGGNVSASYFDATTTGQDGVGTAYYTHDDGYVYTAANFVIKMSDFSNWNFISSSSSSPNAIWKIVGGSGNNGTEGKWPIFVWQSPP